MSDAASAGSLKPGKKAEEQRPDPEEIGRLRERMLRLQADFENARKRWLKEQAEIQESANADLIRQLLEVLDDFGRALTSGAGVPEDAGSFRKGVEMISQRLEELVKSYGVSPMDAVGQPFDPARHEAVAHEVSDSVPESTVVAELRRGYVMNGRVLRPSVVKVSTRSKGGVADGKGNRD